MTFRKLCSTVVLAAGLWAGTVAAAIIDFGGLPGVNGDPLAPYSEDGFTVTPTRGNWFEAHAFGNPVPSIFAGPIGSPLTSQISVVDSDGDDFTFRSVDFSSNNGDSEYTIEGFLNGVSVLLLTDVTGGFPGPWNTVSDLSGTVIDELQITLNPTGSPTSMNVDNICLNAGRVCSDATVPEPGSLLALLTGLAVLGFARRRARRDA
jgi:PEP-CTERM motif-containing protein